KGSLRPGGCYFATDGVQNLVLTMWTSRIGDKRVVFRIPPRYTKKDLQFIKGLIEAGAYRAVIDRRYPMAEVVEAARYVETERKTGNVILNIISLIPHAGEPAESGGRLPAGFAPTRRLHRRPPRRAGR